MIPLGAIMRSPSDQIYDKVENKKEKLRKDIVSRF